MRKQYYFRRSSQGLLAWDVDRLLLLTATLPVRAVPLTQVRELDEPMFDEPMFDATERPTWRSCVEHLQLVDEAELAYPIILAADGAVMDGCSTDVDVTDMPPETLWRLDHGLRRPRMSGSGQHCRVF